jgi:hypothetical protein
MPHTGKMSVPFCITRLMLRGAQGAQGLTLTLCQAAYYPYDFPRVRGLAQGQAAKSAGWPVA